MIRYLDNYVFIMDPVHKVNYSKVKNIRGGDSNEKWCGFIVKRNVTENKMKIYS